MMNITSVFLFEHFKDKRWVKSYGFYRGKLFSEINIKTDWRTKAVKGKSKQAIFLGYVKNIKFPIEYPLKTIENQIINRL